TGLLAATQKKLVRRFYTAPLAVSHIADSRAKYYTIMRLAIPRDVAWIVTANPSTLLLLAKTADENREHIIRDIHDGTLCEEMPISGDTRAALAPRLVPDPVCARRLEQIVANHGVLLPQHYWNLGFRAHWCGGTMGLYETQFPRYYGEVPARDIGLIASEGRMSIPVEDGTAEGILDVTSQFFEFIPASEYGSENPATLRSHELSIGEEYFLVLTNAGGLYRYDLGDRVRVTGREGEAPLIEFLSRDDHTASMAGEKLTEDQVVMAMREVLGNVEKSKCQNVKTSRLLEETAISMEGVSIHRFVLSPRWAEVPRYRLYVEGNAAQRVDRLPDRLDRALCEINLEYAQKRSTLRLESIELAELPQGALAERERRLRLARSHTAEQFKHQYLLPRPGLDTDLEQAPSAI
ncbi:MAG: GH3 auxin-responsive promoter family protein, partial [Phycisphaerae bacterium]